MLKKLAVLAAVSLLVVACGAPDSATAPAGPGKQDDGGASKDSSSAVRSDDARSAPDFEVTTFEGDAFSLSAQRGMLVVLNFWDSL